MRAVSNTSPLCYLILIEEIGILPELFTEIVIPPAVSRELAHPDAPVEVRDWIGSPPEWLSVVKAPESGEDEETHRPDVGRQTRDDRVIAQMSVDKRMMTGSSPRCRSTNA